jgi:hypothetical protein
MSSSVAFILGVLLTTAFASVIALFFAGDRSQIWDILKLAIQGIGALIIARLTVRWAIDTFKSQKRWERDAATFANLLSALREMKRVADVQWQNAIHAKNYSANYMQRLDERWLAAKAKFEDAAAGSVFLPHPIRSVALKLEGDLASAGPFDTYEDELDHTGYLIGEALSSLEEKKGML